MNLGSSSKGSMSTATSGVGRRSGDVVPDQFPAGLRVLVVDDDPTCLMILGKMLRTCYYEVTKCNRAERALSLLRENRNGYDIVISDVHMPDMDGFKLLEHIGLEMDLPVIMMSADDGKQVVMKGVTHGACDYLIKPVRIEALRNIWQHVIRKKKTEWKDLEQSGSVEEGGDRQPKQSEDADYSSSANEGSWRSSKRKKDEDEEEAEDRDDTSNLKKPRVVWSVELHQQFVAAVNQLGIDKAVPKKILELMNVPGLTRENVASHLQKYRLYLRRISGPPSHSNNLTNSFLGTQEAPYGLSSFSGIDLQTLAATGQLPAQSLATLQASGLGRSTSKARVPLPVVDQRNLLSFENPKLRFVDGQQHLTSGKQMNLLHGIPTTMEPKQLVSFHHSGQSLGGMTMQIGAHGGQGGQSGALLMQMSQQQSRVQMLNENSGNHVPRLPATTGQPIISNAIVGGLPINGLAENGSRGNGYNSASQSSSMLNLPLKTSAELPVTTFPLGSTPGMSSLNPKGTYREGVESEIKGSGGFVQSYDIFSDLNQHKSNDWELHNISLPFQQTNNLQSNLDVGGPSILGHSSGQRNGQNRDVSSVVKPMFSAADATGQHMIPYFSENAVRVKAERVSDQNTLFPEQFGQEDLMSALLKQQQGAIGTAENDFDFDGYPLDNIQV